MKRITIKKSDFDHLVEKEDVCIVYLTNNKSWVCDKNIPIESSNDFFITLNLATKGKCETK